MEKKFENIFVDSRKLSAYLLDIHHPDGNSKANFFIRHKFNEPTLLKTILNHLESNEATLIIPTAFGVKYIVEGRVMAPDGFEFRLRSVWMELRSTKNLNFVTAYPL